MKKLPPYKNLQERGKTTSCRSDSCRFGSPHLKSFRFTGVHVELAKLARRCNCSDRHLVVQGKFTKASATYTWQLANTLAEVLGDAIKKLGAYQEEDTVLGKETQLVNEVACSSKWRVVDAWSFRKPSAHINIKEAVSFLKVVYNLARLKRTLRVACLVDSFVVRGAVSKGR